MAKLDELIEQMRNNPSNVRYADACKVADAFFGAPRQKGSSHRVWKMPWPGDPRVNMQEGQGGKAKAYQVEQLLQAIDRLGAELAKAREPTPKEAQRAEAEPKKTKKKGRRS